MRYVITDPESDSTAVAVGGAEVRVWVMNRKLVIDVCADDGKPFDDAVFDVYRAGRHVAIILRVLRSGEPLTAFELRREAS